LKIGICLSSVPGYSETFIRATIKGLLDAGFDVRIFLFKNFSGKDDFKYVTPFPVFLLFYPIIPIILIALFIKRPIVTVRFIRLEYQDGRGALAILKRLYINAHILFHGELDWIHFSFATLAIGNENVSLATKAKLAVSLRGFDIGLYPLTHPGCYSKLWKRVNKIHTISDDLYHLAISDGLSTQVHFQKIRPAIDVSRLERKNLPGSLHSTLQILSVGRLEWKKGFIYALQAMYELRQRQVNFNYTIVGVGSSEQELKYAIRDLGLEDSVILLGKKPHSEIFKLMSLSDIYVQPSVQEGFCNSLLEAQGTGLLCIATDAEGLAENVLHGKTGWIVNKRDPAALAGKVLEVIKMDEGERARISYAAMDRINEEFKLSRLVAEYKMFYKI